MSKLARLLVTTALALTSVHAWQLISSHTSIVPRLTENVSMLCSHDPTFQNRHPHKNMSLVLRIHLLKQNSHDLHWSSIAAIVANDSAVYDQNDYRPDNVIFNTSGLASGNLGRLNESFLSVRWPVASEDMIGSYLCAIDGLTGPRGEDAFVKSDVRNITSKAVAADDAWNMAFKLKDSSEHQTTELITQVTAMAEGLKSENDKERREVVELFKRVAEDFKDLESESAELHGEFSKSLMHLTDKAENVKLDDVKERDEFSKALQNVTVDIEDMKAGNVSDWLQNVQVTEAMERLELEKLELRRDLNESMMQVTDKIGDVKAESAEVWAALSTPSREVTTKIGDWDSENTRGWSQIGDSLKDVQDKVDDMKFKISKDWPRGYFSLMSTSDGCPETMDGSFSKYSFRFADYATRVTYNHSFAAAGHLDQTTSLVQNGRVNFMTIQYCVRRETEIVKWRSWPKGAYCLATHVARQACPEGFRHGAPVMQFDNNGRARIELPDQEDVSVNYCCRNDGNPMVPVYLPTRKPFYLYRYQGPCQEVLNMVALPERVDLDAGNAADGDIYGNRSTPSLQLCYYRQAKLNLRDPILLRNEKEHGAEFLP